MNIILTIIFLLISALYKPLNKRKSKYYWKSRYDALVPFVPAFVVPYVGFFPFIAGSIALLWNSPYGLSLLVALIAAKIMAIIFWYTFPNGVKRPKIRPETRFHTMLLSIYHHDGDTNGFPSSHVFDSLICAYFLALGYPAYAPVIWVIGITIAISTVFTKQHYILDVFGGISIFVLASFVTHFVGLPVFL